MPGEHEAVITEILNSACRGRRPIRLDVRGPWSIGRGVAYRLASRELEELRSEVGKRRLGVADAAGSCALPTPHHDPEQGGPGRRPPLLLERLQLEFEPFDIVAEALLVWRYLGGPWEAIARLPFQRGHDGLGQHECNLVLYQPLQRVTRPDWTGASSLPSQHLLEGAALEELADGAGVLERDFGDAEIEPVGVDEVIDIRRRAGPAAHCRGLAVDAASTSGLPGTSQARRWCLRSHLADSSPGLRPM